MENLQREALNPLEEAEGYQTLMDRFELSQAEVAGSVGKNRSTVANLLRLLRLPPSIKKMLSDPKESWFVVDGALNAAPPRPNVCWAGRRLSKR